MLAVTVSCTFRIGDMSPTFYGQRAANIIVPRIFSENFHLHPHTPTQLGENNEGRQKIEINLKRPANMLC